MELQSLTSLVNESPKRRTDKRVRPYPQSEDPVNRSNFRQDITIHDVSLSKQRSDQQVSKLRVQ